MVAAAVLLLVERGRLGLDDDLRKHLPGLPAFHPDRPVRVRDLLQHTSGLRDYLTLLPRWNGPREDFGDADLIALLRDAELRNVPGARCLFSNSNYRLAGMLVERVSGRPLGELLTEEMFRPLGMAATRLGGPAATVGFEPRPGGGFRPAAAMVRAGGDAGIWTTAEDMIRWEDALAGGRLLRRETWAAVWAPGRRDDGGATRYGLGWKILRDPPHGLTARHDGSWEGFRAHHLRMIDHRVSVVVLSNNGGLDAAALADQVADTRLPPR